MQQQQHNSLSDTRRSAERHCSTEAACGLHTAPNMSGQKSDSKMKTKEKKKRAKKRK
jgi:hypothetical protein